MFNFFCKIGVDFYFLWLLCSYRCMMYCWFYILFGELINLVCVWRIVKLLMNNKFLVLGIIWRLICVVVFWIWLRVVIFLGVSCGVLGEKGMVGFVFKNVIVILIWSWLLWNLIMGLLKVLVMVWFGLGWWMCF